jgi:hypothetical protein
MSAKTNFTTAAIDATAQAIRDAKRAAHELHEATDAAREAQEKIENALRAIYDNRILRDDATLAELHKLGERLEHVRRLRNQAETGALSIRIYNVMDDAWRKLP